MRFRRFIFAVCFLLASFAFLKTVAPSLAHAQGTQAWTGVCVYTTADGQKVATIQGFQCLIANMLGIAVSGIGLAGFVMLIIGAFRFLLSGGNAKGTEQGKNTITFAVVGLVVALSAYFVLNIISDFTGVNSILNFKINTDAPTAVTGGAKPTTLPSCIAICTTQVGCICPAGCVLSTTSLGNSCN